MYNAYNCKQKKKILYRIGCDSGFFSEYNNMIIAIYYALINDLQFILYSKNANFSYNLGWRDYFMPFTKEDNQVLNNIFNTRYSKPRVSGIKMRIGNFLFKTYLFSKDFDFLTYDIFNKSRSLNIKEIYEIPELGLKGNLFENCKIINRLFWQYNDVVKAELNALVTKVLPNEPFISFHIRRGDKIRETELYGGFGKVELDTYIKLAEKHSGNVRTVFVATDDFTVFEQLCGLYSNWKFITLSVPKNRGYDQSEFNKVSPLVKREEMLQLFASIEIMSKSFYFFGTLSSNIGMHMWWRMPAGKCFGVDMNEWKIW